jgi:Holliday junction DNA helicase RuvA
VISRLHGTLLVRGPETVEVETGGGVVYEVEVPLTVLQRLPAVGSTVQLRTVQVVTETAVLLFGFLDAHERALFRRLLTANGVGAKLAASMMSAFPSPRLARALAEKDLTALQQVSGIGRKKAEKIALELADKVADLAVAAPGTAPGTPGEGARGASGAVQALVALGYTFTEADQAVRRALDDGVAGSTEDVVKRALSYR